MKYCRFQQNTQVQYGLVESVAGRESIVRILLTPPEESGGDIEGLRTRRIEPISVDEAVLLPPVRPSKIVCIGRNYREHAAELGNEIPTEPLIFFKPPSALLATGGTILRPKISEHTDYEGELGVVIAKRCHKLPSDEDTRPYILGYTCVNDFTARDLQKKDSQWTRAKGFDTFLPISHEIPFDRIPDPHNVLLWLSVNGEMKQKDNSNLMLFNIPRMLSDISKVMALEEGDIILTGTPKGVGPLKGGDVVKCGLEADGREVVEARMEVEVVDDQAEGGYEFRET